MRLEIVPPFLADGLSVFQESIVKIENVTGVWTMKDVKITHIVPTLTGTLRHSSCKRFHSPRYETAPRSFAPVKDAPTVAIQTCRA